MEVDGLTVNPDGRTTELLVKWGLDKGQDFVNCASRLRPEEAVMLPANMRTAQASAVSFADTLVRKMESEAWTFTLRHSDVDTEGAGVLAYDISTRCGELSFGVRSVLHSKGEERLGRLRENTFDLYGVLLEGPVNMRTLADEHVQQVSKAWAGRSAGNALGWSFANRSRRMFTSTIESLAARHSPTLRELTAGGGYLVRNAGFYGNGRHGSKSWLTLPQDHPLAHPYHVDLLSLYMWKLASLELVEQAAKARDAEAMTLSAEYREAMGVGNSSGIGTVATLVRWPTTLAAVSLATEVASARGLDLLLIGGPDAARRLADLLSTSLLERRATYPLRDDVVAQTLSKVRNDVISGEFSNVVTMVGTVDRDTASGIVASCVASVDPDVGLKTMSLVSSVMRRLPVVDPAMTVRGLLGIVEHRYRWVTVLAENNDTSREHFWYRSSENGENRRGERSIDPGVELETFVDVAHAVRVLHGQLLQASQSMTVGEWLLNVPEQTALVARVQLADEMPYTEIHGNLVSAQFVPSDLIRFFLSALGMRRVLPASDLWLGGVFLAGSPAVVVRELTAVGVETSGSVAEPDDVRLGYPELRRLLPDALRVCGVPAGMTTEVAELLTWTEAAMAVGIDAVFNLPRFKPEAVRLTSVREIDLGGQSLAVFGTRLCDYLRSLPASTASGSLTILNCAHLSALPFMARYLASHGLTVEASAQATLALGATAATAATFRCVATPSTAGGSTWVNSSFAFTEWAGDFVGSCTVTYGEAHTANNLVGTNLSEVYDSAMHQGMRVSWESYVQLREVVSRLRIPTSERSERQAG